MIDTISSRMSIALRLAGLSLFAAALFAQQPAAGRAGAAPAVAAKNVKVLAPTTDIAFTMRGFNAALGVQCTFCHVQGDFASDANPKKDVARKMISMIGKIDAAFPSSSGAYPAGYHEVDCVTCHRGAAKPVTETAKVYHNLNEFNGHFAPNSKEPGTNLKVLPADTLVHGEESIMHVFRDALKVDCSYCHGFSKPFAADDNPRKEIARKMITMVRDINTNFPGTGTYPLGKQAVTCYTCHRGDPHPESVSNKDYELPAEKK